MRGLTISKRLISGDVCGVCGRDVEDYPPVRKIRFGRHPADPLVFCEECLDDFAVVLSLETSSEGIKVAWEPAEVYESCWACGCRALLLNHIYLDHDDVPFCGGCWLAFRDVVWAEVGR